MLRVFFTILACVYANQSPAVPLTTGEDSTSAEIFESAVFKPELIYRQVFLSQRESSAYHNAEEHRDWVDQLYLALPMRRTYNYEHEVVLEPVVRTVRNSPANLEAVIDQAYVSLRFNSFLGLIAGKKTEYEGSGFIVSPSDLVHDNKDVFDSLYQREGVVLSKIVFTLKGTSLSLGMLPIRARDLGEASLLVQASTELAGADVRLSVTHQEEEKSTTGLSASRFFGSSFELHFDGRYQTRQRSIIETNNSLRERRFSSYEQDEASAYYVLGSRLIGTPRRTVIIEWITNQSGLLPDEMERYFQSERYTDEEQTVRRRAKDVYEPDARLIGRHYGFFAYKDEESLKNVGLQLSVLVNTDDQSVFSSLSALWVLSSITSVELTPTFFRGGYQAEFGETPFMSTIYLSLRGAF